jgi:sialate O-acetylesterase
MKMNMKRFGWLSLCYLLLLAQTGFCEVRLPALISDGMVLQREARVKIWGWADEGEKVRIDFNGKIFTTCTGPRGQMGCRTL